MFGNNGFLSGKRVYGSGGFAPNRGRVSARGTQGYLRRSLTANTRANNMHGSEGYQVGATRFGNDGQSDTRSGLAQAAMSRLGGHGGGVMNDGPKFRPGMPTPGRPVMNGGGNRPGSGGGNPVPHVVIGKNGQMKLPYDADYSDQVMGSLTDFNNQLQQLQLMQQQQGAQYNQGMRDESLGYTQQQKADLGQDSGAGMAFSSRYATDVGNTANTHQSNVNTLNLGNGQFNQQIMAQKAAIQDQFNSQLQQAALQRARNASTRAGSLGYGRSNNPGKHKGNNNGRKKGKR